MTGIEQALANATVLVTGGTGSLGQRLVWELLRLDPRAVVVMSRDEKKQYDMRRRFGGEGRLYLELGDVRDEHRVREVFDAYGPSIVVHAAALKHVVGCEIHPMEAVKTNIIGTANVVGVSRGYCVPHLVAISTDKATKPLNVMGMSKALMERITLGAGYVAVRYGNVIGSRGSVVPFFARLIGDAQAAGQRATIPVTDYRMTRFLMTVGDAVQLVFRALTIGAPGELHVRLAPAARVTDLATALARQAGALESEFEEIGFTHGEKLHEELISQEEGCRATWGDGYAIVRPGGPLVKHPLGPVASCAPVLSLEEIASLLDRAAAEQVACEFNDGWFVKG